MGTRRVLDAEPDLLVIGGGAGALAAARADDVETSPFLFDSQVDGRRTATERVALARRGWRRDLSPPTDGSMWPRNGYAQAWSHGLTSQITSMPTATAATGTTGFRVGVPCRSSSRSRDVAIHLTLGRRIHSS